MIPSAFTKTLRSLDGTRHTGTFLRLGAGAAILCALGWWMWKVPVALFEVSSEARLEIASSATLVQSAMVGRVVRADLPLGKTVKAGDILVQLDALSEELQKREAETHVAAVQPEIDGLRAQIAAEESAGADERRASLSAMEEQRMRVKEAESPIRFAEADQKRYEQLTKAGLSSGRDVEKAVSEVEKLRSSVNTAHAAIDRLEREQKARDRQRAVRVAELQTQIARLEGSRAGMTASIRKVDYDVERRVIRAPVGGIIGEAALLHPGSVLQEGTRVISIVAKGQLRIVAFFTPQAAYGRMQMGSRAKLRLKGYPWT